VVTIDGTAGVGKTTTAVYWAHEITDRFPDGQFYANLRGFDPAGPPRHPDEVLLALLEALHVPRSAIPADLEARAGLFRSLVADRRILVLLDNAADAAQVRPLLPGSRGCLTLVTSRRRLTALIAQHGAYPLTLGLLSAQDSRSLLVQRLGAERVAAEPAGVADLVRRCAGLPLALTVVAARAAARPHFPFAAIVDDLRGAERRLDALDGGEASVDVRSVFSWSLRQLSDPALTLFHLLGVHPGPDLSAPAAASLLGVTPRDAARLLAELTDAHLVDEHLPGRFAFHDLLRAYAAESPRVDTGPALRRMFDHYLHSAHAASVTARSVLRDPLALDPPEPGASPECFVAPADAHTWFAAEHAVLLRIIALAARAGFDRHAWQLAWAVQPFLDLRGCWRDLRRTQRIALAAAERAADRDGQAVSHRFLALAQLRVGSRRAARAHLYAALALFRERGDRTGEAKTHHNLAEVSEQDGQLEAALRHARCALNLHTVAGDRLGQARAGNAVGWYHTLLGDHTRALDFCRKALAELRTLGDRHGQAGTWDSLGRIHHRLGRHDRAVESYRRALSIFRELGDAYYEADTLVHLGEVHHDAGNPDAARGTWQRAYAILTRLSHADAERVRALLGDDETGWRPAANRTGAAGPRQVGGVA
jgi:tetratricopeptide (TPR) repeat protein